VKQKLSELLPEVHQTEVKGGASEVEDSMDDTLRSTTPLPEDTQSVICPETKQPSPSSHLFLRSNSYTLEQPSEALLSADKVPILFLCL